MCGWATFYFPVRARPFLDAVDGGILLSRWVLKAGRAHTARSDS